MSKIQIYGNELYHYGILGQSWGNRRYQNEDGTYTEEGKARRRVSDEQSAKFKKNLNKAFIPSVKGGKDKPPVSPAEYATKRTGEIVNNIRSINSHRKDPVNNEDLTKYSDEDLRRMINRMNLEKQYRDLSSKEINTGKVKVDEILDIVGSVVGIAGGVAGMIAILKGGK